MQTQASDTGNIFRGKVILAELQEPIQVSGYFLVPPFLIIVSHFLKTFLEEDLQKLNFFYCVEQNTSRSLLMGLLDPGSATMGGGGLLLHF